MHIIKNIKNNWLNKLDNEKIYFPNFESYSIQLACFGDFRELYQSENKLLVAYRAYKLNQKALYPNSFQKYSLTTIPIYMSLQLLLQADLRSAPNSSNY